ncbi:hypothetical protein [Lysinibacillus sp. NPDC086135]|uniref:hypothetical protein n=1 Tax=Lysinibacillus sp. NPDC086135 TaxID=3364130 RepID=UPI0038161B79
MTESTQTNASSQNTTFIHDLIEMTRKDDKDLKAFIDSNLFPKKSSLSFESIKNNIDSLKVMDHTQQVIVKARAKEFEESHDPSKYIPSLIAIVSIIGVLYSAIKELSGNSAWSVFLHSMVIAFLIIYINRTYERLIKIRPTAIYFNSLIANIKYDNE